ncbi:hypothetical protein Cgig2_011997 [Carnegiea gigantea]|uniref:DJ-1/PfpI domain-containing protein n=1 Tax=Carnegiea gigantea TaxID=171969 RepID=A0A9Q1KR41_9CARY|nr:hypothetical protein Cgig2_011997 [Carnegiea gigantea]
MMAVCMYTMVTAFEFALSLVEQLYTESIAQEVRDSLLVITEDDHSKEEFNQVEWSLDHPPHALIRIANGSNEIEIVTIADIVRRARINVVIASTEKSLQIAATHGTKIVADKSLSMAAESTYDLIILSGGGESWVVAPRAGGEEGTLLVLIAKQDSVTLTIAFPEESADRIDGAICSSPAVLQAQGLAKDKRTRAFPSILEKLTCKVINGAKVVIDGKLITSKWLASTSDFCPCYCEQDFWTCKG